MTIDQDGAVLASGNTTNLTPSKGNEYRPDSITGETDHHGSQSQPPQAVHKDDSQSGASPKVRYRVEYREMKDGMLLYTKDMTENKKQLAVHEGPVFDVVDVNHTSETKDTQKSKQDTNERGPKAVVQSDPGSFSAPSVHVRGRSYIRIYSRAILNALQSVVNYYPNYDIVAQPTELYEPYPILVHHWDEIIQFRERFNPSRVTEDTSDCGMNDTYEHLGLLLDFLEEKMGAKVREEQERWKQPVPKVSFEMIWLLLKPGIDVYEHLEEDGTKEPWIVSRVSFDIFDQSWDNYTVDVWYLGHDATAILPKSAELKINRFHGEKPIQELNLFPCEYYQDHKIRQKDMIERGKLFVHLQEKRCMYFDGESNATPRQPVRNQEHNYSKG